STSGMVRQAAKIEAQDIIVATEWGLAYRLARENPAKRFYVFPEAVCPNMKKTKLSSVVRSLREMSGQIEIDADVIARARSAVEKMIAIS
ncbi:MAG: quinolinate synthase NadA, partial [Armatimonadetes bacterium]|nr:quinolinate synthase NadA [Armatimonadota bacterium]